MENTNLDENIKENIDLISNIENPENKSQEILGKIDERKIKTDNHPHISENEDEHNNAESSVPTNQENLLTVNHEAKFNFYDNLRTVIKTQENILNMTGMAKEKIKYANEISIDQLNTFKENSMKYGKYLKLIHEELLLIGDLMKKMKKNVKEQ